ncbi:MAG: elongation factor Ts, partial [Chlamydiae bacterium]|nr:elongation factor Ts [Chlamydiota bacterium]
YFNQVCLLNQKFIKDPDLTVEKLLAKHGKDLTVSQFLRWGIGL